MRFHIVGAGSIGTLIAHNLRLTTRAPISVIYKRGRQFPSIRTPDQHGEAPLMSFSVKRGDRLSHSTNFDIEKIHDGALIPGVRAEELEYRGAEPPNGSISSLIVCLKTQDTLPALRILAPRLSPDSVITLIQNGMGVYDELCSHLFTSPASRPHFILGTTTHGVTSNYQEGMIYHVSKPGEGEIKFGVVPDPRREVNMDRWLFPDSSLNEHILTPPRSPTLPLSDPPVAGLDNIRETLSTLLAMSDLSPSLLPMPHLHHQLLIKLAINSVINPLTAVLGLGALRNGALQAIGPGRRLVRYVIDETSAILTAYMYSLSNPAAPAPDVIRMFSPASLERRCIAVIHQTQNNQSSMAADVARSKLTEIGQINGYLVSLALRLGVPAPTHRMLTEMVKFVSGISTLSPKLPLHHRLALRKLQTSLVNEKKKSVEERRLEVDEQRNLLKQRSIHLREMEWRELVLQRRRIRNKGKNNTQRLARSLRRRMEAEYLARGLEIGQPVGGGQPRMEEIVVPDVRPDPNGAAETVVATELVDETEVGVSQHSAAVRRRTQRRKREEPSQP